MLLILFWAVHLGIMMIRAELNDTTEQVGFLESFARRGLFALFGAFLGYLLYRCLRLLRNRDFVQQAALGAALALAAACIQAIGNVVVFNNGSRGFEAAFLYSAMYWFWFYFCWATAYLALSFSIAVQAQERRAAELAIQAQEAQVRALRYQINPHFLFNTLNAIATLIRDAPNRAEEMVVQLSDFFRRSLAVKPMEDLPLAQEVELQCLYLEIERTRFPDRMQLDVQLDPGTGEVRVPALLLQPLVENAVKHGVAPSEALTSIRISARLEGPSVKIMVENDSRLTGASSGGEGIGLRNVEERLRSRFGDEASFSFGETPAGYRNTLLIPVRR